MCLGLGRSTAPRRSPGDDALHQRLPGRLETDEAESHPRSLARGVGAHHHALAPQERGPVGEDQIEEERRADRLRGLGGEEKPVTAHVGAITGDELVLAAEGQPDAERRRREHAWGSKMPRIRALPKSWAGPQAARTEATSFSTAA